MILMWLGSFVVMLFALAESQRHFALATSRFLRKGLDSEKSIFIASLLEVSPQRTLYTGMSLYNLRVLSLRSSVLLMCLSTLGAWFALLLAGLFLEVNGLLVIGVSSIFLLSFFGNKLSALMKLLFFAGLFLLGSELMLRQGSGLMTLMNESDLAYYLADGRFVAIGFLLFVSIVMSIFLEIEFWSLALGLSLMVSNVLSFNGALAIFAGERVGRVLIFWWRSRDLNQDCQRLGKYFSLVSGSGAFLGFVIAGTLRMFAQWEFAEGEPSMQDKAHMLVLLCAVILFIQFLAQMIWGHFAARVKVDELQEAKYFSVSWLERDLISVSSLKWAKGKVLQRLSEIKYHLQGLNTVKAGQIPDILQSRLKAEEEQLTKLAQRLNS